MRERPRFEGEATRVDRFGMDRRIDLIGSIGVVAFGVAVLVLSGMQQEATVEFDSIGPMGLPRVLGALFIVVGALQTVRTVRGLRRFGRYAPHDGSEDEPEHHASALRGLAFIAGSIGYLALMPVLGYLIATPLVIVAGLWALEFRRPLPLALIAILFTVVGFYLFGIVLSVPLPTGLLTDVLVRIGLIDAIR
ncbi:MAG: hypothetical protein RLZZ272_602 [Actinomycetota bacterium]|jgi:hypothetical protein